MWRKWRAKWWSGWSGSRGSVAALVLLVIVTLAGCASPEGALQTADDNATATAAASGPPVLRIATVGVGPTAAVSVAGAASATTMPRAVGSMVTGTAASGTTKATPTSAVVSGTMSAPSASQAATASPSGASARSAPQGTPEPGLLLDPKGRYSFRIPMPWKAETPMAGGVDLEVVCDAPNGLMRTTSVDTPAAVTLDNATLIITEALKKNTLNYEPVPSGSLNAMIGGQAARRIEYYGIYSGTRLHYVSYVIVYNQKTVVTLLFVAQPDNFDRLLMQGSVVLTSFAFIQPGQSGQPG